MSLVGGSAVAAKAEAGNTRAGKAGEQAAAQIHFAHPIVIDVREVKDVSRPIYREGEHAGDRRIDGRSAVAGVACRAVAGDGGDDTGDRGDGADAKIGVVSEVERAVRPNGEAVWVTQGGVKRGSAIAGKAGGAIARNSDDVGGGGGGRQRSAASNKSKPRRKQNENCSAVATYRCHKGISMLPLLQFRSEPRTILSRLAQGFSRNWDRAKRPSSEGSVLPCLSRPKMR